MMQIELESCLKKKIIRRRLISLLIIAVFLTIGIVCKVLFDNSFDDKGRNPELSYLWGISLGFIVSGVSGVLLLIDLILWSYKMITIDDSLITIYRGMFGVSLYIDGAIADSLHTNFRSYLDGHLKDGTKVTVILSRYSLRVNFSNGHAPIDFNYITRD